MVGLYSVTQLIHSGWSLVHRGLRSLTDSFKSVLAVTEGARQFDITVGGVAGSTERGRAIRESLISRARYSPLTISEMLEGGRGAAMLPSLSSMVATGKPDAVAKRMAEYNKLLGQLERLSPEQGIEGVGIAVREFLSGNARSIRQRLEVSPDLIYQSIGRSQRDVLGSPELGLQALQKFADTFVGSSAFAEQATLFSNSVDKVKDAIRRGAITVGESGVYDQITGRLRGIADLINDYTDPKKGTKFQGEAARISTAMANTFDSVVESILRLIGGLSGKTGNEISGVGDIVVMVLEGISNAAKMLPGFVTGVIDFFKSLGGIVSALGGIAQNPNSPESVAKLQWAGGELAKIIRDGIWLALGAGGKESALGSGIPGGAASLLTTMLLTKNPVVRAGAAAAGYFGAPGLVPGVAIASSVAGRFGAGSAAAGSGGVVSAAASRGASIKAGVGATLLLMPDNLDKQNRNFWDVLWNVGVKAAGGAGLGAGFAGVGAVPGALVGAGAGIFQEGMNEIATARKVEAIERASGIDNKNRYPIPGLPDPQALGGRQSYRITPDGVVDSRTGAMVAPSVAYAARRAAEQRKREAAEWMGPFGLDQVGSASPVGSGATPSPAGVSGSRAALASLSESAKGAATWLTSISGNGAASKPSDPFTAAITQFTNIITQASRKHTLLDAYSKELGRGNVNVGNISANIARQINRVYQDILDRQEDSPFKGDNALRPFQNVERFEFILTSIKELLETQGATDQLSLIARGVERLSRVEGLLEKPATVQEFILAGVKPAAANEFRSALSRVSPFLGAVGDTIPGQRLLSRRDLATRVGASPEDMFRELGPRIADAKGSLAAAMSLATDVAVSLRGTVAAQMSKLDGLAPGMAEILEQSVKDSAMFTAQRVASALKLPDDVFARMKRIIEDIPILDQLESLKRNSQDRIRQIEGGTRGMFRMSPEIEQKNRVLGVVGTAAASVNPLLGQLSGFGPRSPVPASLDQVVGDSWINRVIGTGDTKAKQYASDLVRLAGLYQQARVNYLKATTIDQQKAAFNDMLNIEQWSQDLARAKDELDSFKQNVMEFNSGVRGAFEEGFGQVFRNIITNTGKMSDAFKAMGMRIIDVFADIQARNLARGLFGDIGSDNPSGEQGWIGKLIGAFISGWAGGGSSASVQATGQAASPALGNYGAGLPVGYRAGGGFIGGPMGAGDIMPVLATPGEAFMNRSQQSYAAKNYGLDLGEVFRNAPKFAAGGYVPYAGPMPSTSRREPRTYIVYSKAEARSQGYDPTIDDLVEHAANRAVGKVAHEMRPSGRLHKAVASTNRRN